MIYLKNVSTLEYDRNSCTGCGMCIEVCPHNVFEREDGKVKILSKDRCMECGACMMNCAFDAIRVNKGVGCASAVINGVLKGTEPSCGCSDGNSSGCCC